MSSSSDSSKRKVLRLKQDKPDDAKVATEAAPTKVRRPLRGGHLPMRQQRALKGNESETPAKAPEQKPTPTKPLAAGPRRRERPHDARSQEGRPQENRSRHSAAPRAADGERAQRKPRSEPPARGEPPAARGPRPPRPQREDRAASETRPARKPPQGPQHFFAPCPRGLEHELAKELAELGVGQPQAGSGGVAFKGDIALAWKINLWSRLAIRVLQQVAQGSYKIEDDLYQAARGLPWPEWFPLGRTIAVRTVAHRSPLKSLNFASLKIKDALCDRFRDVTGARPDVDTHNPDVPILLFLGEDSYTLYLDLTGEPLNRRGYRVQAAQAPLNENLAAGLLRLAGWTPEMPLLDPMMGGGTILLEAVLIALNIAPGLRRHFAFENLNSFDKVEWAKLRKNAQAAQHEKRALPIYGADIDPRMVWATETNLTEAGLLECVTLREADALEVQAPGKVGLIVSNPPYGMRLKPGRAATASSSPASGRGLEERAGEDYEDMAAFYRGLGDNLKQHFTGWNAYLLSADTELPKHIGLKASKRTPLFNGPLECRLYEYRLVSGQMRRKKPGE